MKMKVLDPGLTDGLQKGGFNIEDALTAKSCLSF